jgi:EamA domain-containing membrane protein RarD
LRVTYFALVITTFYRLYKAKKKVYKKDRFKGQTLELGISTVAEKLKL